MNNSIKKSIKRREMILKGGLWKTIVYVCFPLAIYQFFTAFSTIIDQMLSAHISTVASNAVASIAQLKNTISAFGAGLAAGGAVLVARYYGAGDIKNARGASGNLLLLSIIMSAVIIAIFIPIARPVMQLAQISEESIEIGYTYFVLQLFELALVSINSVFIGLEKAKGNSKLVMILNVVVLVLKISLSCIFVYGFNVGDLLWVEVSSIIAQSLLTCIGLTLMFYKKNILQIKFENFKIKKLYILPIMKLSIPIFFGKFVMNLGKTIVNGLCGSYYNVATNGLIVGALGVSNNISGLTTNITSTFEDGESSIVSQNLGNRNLKRSLRFFGRILLTAAIIALIGYVLTRFIILDQLVALFSNDGDENGQIYMQYIKEIYTYDSLSIPALALCSAVLGLLYGFGKTFLASILNFSRIGIRILSLVCLHYGFPNLAGTTCAGISMAISNGLIFLLSLICLLVFYINLRKKGFNGMHLGDPEPDVSELKF